MNVIDVIRNVTGYMDNNFSQYPVQDRDIKDVEERPCTIIDVDNIQSDLQAVGYIRDSFDITIYVFVEDINTGFLELLDCKNELLLWLSKSISIDDMGYVTPTDVTAEIYKADKALAVSFNIEIVQHFDVNDEIDLDDMLELEYH